MFKRRIKKSIGFGLTLVILISTYILSGNAMAIIENTVYSPNYTEKVSDELQTFFAENDDVTTDVVIWSEDTCMPVVESATLTATARIGVSDSKQYEEYLATIEDKDRQLEEIQAYIAKKRSTAAKIYYESNFDFVTNDLDIAGNQIKFVSKYSPLVICELTQSEAISVANNDKVQLMEAEPKYDLTATSVTEDDYTDEYLELLDKYTNYPVKPMTQVRSLIGANEVISAGYNGSGIILGMLDGGVPDTSLSVFSSVSNKMDCRTGDTIDEHATMVAAIMIGNYGGIATGVSKLYCAGIDVETDGADDIYEGIEYLIDKNVNIINMSLRYSRVSGAVINTYETMSKWMDHLAYNHSVHLIIAAGNMRPTDTTAQNTVGINATSYNAIVVGNVADPIGNNSIADYEWCEMSSYSTLSNMAYKPDISAPGTRVYIPSICDYNTNNAFIGTSVSAPVVSASIALLLDFDPYLLLKQALVKSILLTSVHENTVRNYNATATNYRKYGGGIINISNALTVAALDDYVNTSMTNSQSAKNHTIAAGTPGSKVTVTLSFLKRVRFSISDHTSNAGGFSESDLPNLNISVYFASDTDFSDPIVTSNTTYNNVEKLTFTRLLNEAYVVRVTKVLPYNDSHEILYAVAWYDHNTPEAY